jgi:membrane associated rhomboid family serine protease
MAVVSGLLVGTALAPVVIDGLPLTLLLLQDNSLVSRGLVWQLVTSIIVAPPTLTGLLDVSFNAVALALLDGLFSVVYGRRQYYLVFLATAIAGNILSLANGPREVSFGASGGIFGLLAGAVSFDFVTNRRFNPALLLWFAAVFFVSSFAFSYVDWVAHAGGALLGLALGYAVGIRREEDAVVGGD